MRRLTKYFCYLGVFIIGAVVLAAPQKDNESGSVFRATLPNGLRVVIIRNTLAPVVTVEENYLAGEDETPPGFPGLAHAQEHMAFRGCQGISGDQTAAIYAQLGGLSNADTQQNITQYFATVPAADIDIALRMDAACMQSIEDSNNQWEQERGAIEQEVARDLSNPIYKFITRLNEDMFANTPYAHDALGTKQSFDATTGGMLQQFAGRWYAPNNAILVISGDVDPQTALKQITQYYGGIPKRPLPPRSEVRLSPVKSETMHLDSNLPYALVLIAYRMPGTRDPDYAAARVLSDVLASRRGNLYALVPQGKALQAEFGMSETYPLAGIGYAITALPAASDGEAMAEEVKRILNEYSTKGFPPELIEAAKRVEVTNAEFRRNSIPELASLWSEALAANGRNSPDDDVAAIRKVTAADVNRVAQKYLRDENSVAGILKPVPAGGPVASKGFGSTEKPTSQPSKPVELPDWAARKLAALEIPKTDFHPVDTKLHNGLRLIVETVHASPTVTLLGNVRHEADLETPPHREGEDKILDELFEYGSQTLDRLSFQKALDDIGATETAGYDFSVRVLKSNFSRGVQLLADNELNPALPATAFDVVQKQVGDLVRGNLESPAYRTQRALVQGTVPAGDPSLREATPESVAAVRFDDVRKYYSKTIRPDLATIVVIGDVTPQEAQSIVEKWFGEWKTEGAQPDTVLPPVPPNKASAFTVPDPEELQDNVVLAEQLEMNRYNPDYYALNLGNHVLGGGFYATRLYHDLRQVTGYVYNVDVRLEATRSRAMYAVVYACDPANSSKAAALIQRDLMDMRNTDVPAGELRQAKSLLLRQLPLRESSEEAIAGGLVARAQLALPLNEPAIAAARYFDLTAEQIRAAFQKWIRPDGFALVVRGPAPE